MRMCDLEMIRERLEYELGRMFPELIPDNSTVKVNLTYLDEDSPAEAVLYATVREGKLVNMEWQQ
jgi:hypothetical protein